jgi:hypothetical protein
MMAERDREKLKTLIHYIAWKVSPGVLGSIKLNKVLWVTDLSSYVGTGKAITGENYVKRQYGPVSPSVPLLVGELEAAKALVSRRRFAPVQGQMVDKVDYIALTEPDIAGFTAEEISLVDSAIDFVCYQHTAMQISDATHDVIWELAELGEVIPYAAMLASALGEVTAEDVTWAKTFTGSVVAA